MTTTVITGASQGLGLALAHAFAERGHRLVLDARRPAPLAEAVEELRRHTDVVALPGDIADPVHRAQLVEAVGEELSLLIHNASTLGPTPLRPLAALGADQLADILATNLIAPHALSAALLPALRRAGGTVLGISSDAAVAHYRTWGGYAAAKAGLDHILGTWAVEEPALHWYSLDPGDMRTAMHAAAFPGEDISDRPLPEAVVPAVLTLLDILPASGRYRAAEFASASAGGTRS